MHGLQRLGVLLECGDQIVVAGILITADDLNPGGTIFMHDLRNPRLPGLVHIKGDGHERCRVIGLNDVSCHGVQHARTERPPALTELDLLIDPIGNAWCVRAAQDASSTERPGSELHATLKPANDLCSCNRPGRLAAQGFIVLDQFNLEEARARYDQALSIDPNNAEEFCKGAVTAPLHAPTRRTRPYRLGSGRS